MRAAQQMQGIWLVGMALQYLLIDSFRMRQAARRVVLYGKVYGLLDR